MKKWIISICFGMLGVALFAQTEFPKPILFITDASGSMWQKVGSEYKIDIARRVLKDLVLGMPESQSIGLIAYGHRDKSDCNDIEQLLAINNLDRDAFSKALEDLNPLGKTPLAQSALFAIDQIKKSENPATVILITDGIETCEGDICDVVTEAKAQGVEFVMHIVGFDLGNADRTILECAARTSDGLYIDASNQAQLSNALQQTSALTIDIPKGALAVTCKRNGQPIDGLISVYKTGTDSITASLRSYLSPETNPAIFHIPAGSYDIEVKVVGQRGILPMKKSNLSVSEADTNFQLFDFSSGYIELTVLENEALHDATVNIRLKGDSKSLTSGRTYRSAGSNPLKKELAPGLYDVDIKSVSIKGLDAQTTIEDVIIKAGETSIKQHNFESSELSISTTFQGKLCDGSINILSVSTRKSVHGGRTYANANSNPKTFLLSPGEYEIDVRGIRLEGDPRERFTIVLKPREVVEKIIKW